MWLLKLKRREDLCDVLRRNIELSKGEDIAGVDLLRTLVLTGGQSSREDGTLIFTGASWMVMLRLRLMGYVR